MQFIDLAAQQKRIREKIEKGIQGVLDHGQYIMGPEIKTLEENLARFVIEGVPGGKTVFSPDHTANEDCTYVCTICNKYMNVAKGKEVPLCCGREMEAMD